MFLYLRNVFLFAVLATMLSGFTACESEATQVWTEVIYTATNNEETSTGVLEAHPAVMQSYTESYLDTEKECEIYNSIIYDEPPQARKIALTFDDGPIQYTEYILDLLEKYGGRATFCVLGYRVENWTNTVLRTVALGNEIIGHSWGHRNLTMLDQYEIIFQIKATSEAIESVTGAPPPRIFRAPFGQLNELAIYTAKELGYSMLHWSIDPRDWYNRDAEYIYNHIMYYAAHGAIVLLHDIHPTTMEAMTKVIPALVADGFQLVTASEIIEYVYGGLVPGEIFLGLR